MSVPIEEILNLSVKKRLELIEEIWDSIASDEEAIPLTSAQRRELDRRKREHRADHLRQRRGPKFVIVFKKERSEGATHARS